MNTDTKNSGGVTGEHMLSQKALSQEFDIPEGTLEQWRYRNTGPRYYRLGKHVRYRRSDVTTWLETRASSPSEVV